MNLKPLLLSMTMANFLFPQWAVKTKTLTVRGNASVACDYPLLVGKRRPKVRDLINNSLKIISGVQGFVNEAESQLANDPDDVYPYSCAVDFHTGVNDGKIFSVFFNIDSQTGGAATGHNAGKGCVFDARTGKQLFPGDLFSPDFDPKFRELVHEILAKDPEGLIPEWETSLETVQYEYSLNPKGLFVSFPKYSLAPGFMALISFEIPYSDLRSMIPNSSPIAYLVRR